MLTSHYISLPLDQNVSLSGGRILVPVLGRVRGPGNAAVSGLLFDGG